MSDILRPQDIQPGKLPLDRLIMGDCLEVLRLFPPDSFDTVFVDPPYNLQLPKKRLTRWTGTVVNGVNEQWDSFSSFGEYDLFTEAWLEQVKRVMKPNGTIWVIGTYHNIFRVGKIMQDMGFWILNDVIWLKTNPVPNFRRVRFTNGTETLIWAVKDKNSKSYTFDPDKAKEFGYGKVGANLWEIPVCAGKERVKGPDGKRLHPTQKPERLLERVILTSTRPGDTVLDPMAGVCTTPAVARRLGRHFVAVEKREDYLVAGARRVYGR